MSSRTSSFVVNVLAFVVAGAALFLIFRFYPVHPGVVENSDTNNAQTAAIVGSSVASSSTVATATSTPTIATTTRKTPPAKALVMKMSKAKKKIAPSPTSTATSAQTPPVFEITRIKNPYATPPLSFDDVNISARAALVNILCMPQGGASLQPISGSGVIIDPRGVILTNAHVAQYVLLSESPKINLSCAIRTGSPATSRWTAEVLFMPPVWVNAHAAEINTDHPMGTGEHDYALLRIARSIDGSPLPPVFPALSYDTREVIGFLGDPVLGAAYPAEFVGSFNAQNNLNAVSSVSTIAQLSTFATQTVDMISIGGVIEAQSGSSGGAVVNVWDKLIGLITTTSEGQTTAERTLRAMTLSYINRDIRAQTSSDLVSYLQGDLAAKEATFNEQTLPGLIDQYIKALAR